MSDAKYFSKDYDEARSRFRSFQLIDGLTDSYQVPSERDQDLTVDYLEAPATRVNRTLLVLTSGVHGSEAFTGSAIQTMFLTELMQKFPRETTGLLMVHALNPYGFKYNRRATENNVNLNRNFAATADLFQTANKGYDRIAALIDRERKASAPKAAFLDALAYVVRCLTVEGFTGDSLNRAMAHGQFRYPKGLEYGGKTWEPQTKFFIEKLKKTMAPYENVIIFDLHTGLGDRYELHLIPVDEPESRHPELMNQILKPDLERDLYKITDPDAKGFYETAGDLNSLPPKIARSGQKTLTLTFEFGTLGNSTLAKIHSLARVLNENRGFHYGYRNRSAEEKSKAQYLELFAPSEKKWRENAISRAREVLARVLSRL